MYAFDFYYGGEAEQYSFYRIPRALIVDGRFRSISTDAKLLYGLMLDRMGLSLKNKWIDESGRVYIYFAIAEIQETMGCSQQKACKLLAELDSKKGAGLIERKKQGQGKPAKIFVKRFSRQELPTPDGLKSSVQNDENHRSRSMIMESADLPKSSPNYTNLIQTYPSHPYPSIMPSAQPTGIDGCDVREHVKKQINYELLAAEYSPEDMDELVELMCDIYCTTRPTMWIGGEERQTAQVLERFQMLDYEHIKYVEECLSENTSKIHNIRAYLLTALFNAPATKSRYYQAAVQHDFYGP